MRRKWFLRVGFGLFGEWKVTRERNKALLRPAVDKLDGCAVALPRPDRVEGPE